MGIYVNPGNIEFYRSVNDDIYVDKTNLIAYTNSRINKGRRFLCVSRPRRFGKTMAADMLSAYYSCGCRSGELFSGREIEKKPSFLTHLNKHYVIRLDIQKFLVSRRDVPTFIDTIESSIAAELKETFPDCQGLDHCTRLHVILPKIFSRTGKGFVFVIDEWDCVFRMAKEQKEIQKDYLDFLRGLFKGQDYVELAYMTGILPIKKYGEHSAINIFDEYSMIDPKNLGEYFGFTEKEVRKLCSRHKADFAEMEKWYDGYQLCESHIYNPKSVADALLWKKFKNYWTGTETYEALKHYIDLNFDGLKEAVIGMLGNSPCKIDSSTAQNDMTTFKTKDDILTLLVHLGYLTYNEKTEEVSIPNREITQEFLRSVKTGGWDGLIQALARSEALLKSTWDLDGEAVAAEIGAIHNETASLLKYNNENSLTCTILMAYYSAKAYYMKPILELPTGKGFSDVVYLPRRNENCPALIVELKWKGSTQGAISQMKERQYASWIENDTGDILLVGIRYDTASKKHECLIERHVKK